MWWFHRIKICFCSRRSLVMGTLLEKIPINFASSSFIFLMNHERIDFHSTRSRREWQSPCAPYHINEIKFNVVFTWSDLKIAMRDNKANFLFISKVDFPNRSNYVTMLHTHDTCCKLCCRPCPKTHGWTWTLRVVTMTLNYGTSLDLC